MLSASLCSLQSHPFPKFALEPVLCSYCFNSVVLINMVVLFALLKGRERERCLFFFLYHAHPQMEVLMYSQKWNILEK